jgi:hypothetical protein
VQLKGGGLLLSLHHLAVLAVLAGATTTSTLALLWALRGDYELHAGFSWRSGMLPAALAASVLIGGGVLLERVLAWRRGGWLSAASWPFRIGSYVLVLGVVLELALFQPFHKYFLLIHLGLQGGLTSALLWIGFRRPTLLPGRAVRLLDRLLIVLCSMAVGLEGGLRLLSHFTRNPVFDHGPLSPLQKVDLHRFEAGEVFLGMPCNRRGFHDEELQLAPSERLVACIGDSFSVGVVPHYFHYTTVAERALGGVVIDSIGVNACGPREYNLLLETEALPLAPELIVLAVFIGNDIFDSVEEPDDHRWARRIYDRNYSACFVLLPRALRLFAERPRSGDETEDWRESISVEQTPAALIEHFPHLADPLRELPSFTTESFETIERTRAAWVCDPRHAGELEHLFAALETALELADPTPLVVLILPDEFQVEDELWNSISRRNEDGALLERDLPQTLLRAWLKAHGVAYLDVLPVLRAVAPLPDGNRHLYSLRDTHFNRRGNRFVGRALADFLVEQLD